MKGLTLPVCPDCGETVQATLCQARPTTDADVDAIHQVLLAAHRQLAGCRPPVTTPKAPA